MCMYTFLNVRITKSMADELAAHRKRTMVPTSAFVRRAIDELLHPTGSDAMFEAAFEAGEISEEMLNEKHVP